MPNEEWRELYRKWDGITKALRERPPAREPRGSTSRPVIKRKVTNNRRSTVTKKVLHHYHISMLNLVSKSARRHYTRARCVAAWLWYHEVGMTTEQIGVVLRRDYRDVCRLVRKASTDYSQDIHSLLTALGWGNEGRGNQAHDRGGTAG